MSPEQTGRMNRVVDRRTDLYSLGVCLLPASDGRPAVSSHGSARDRAQPHRREPRPAPRGGARDSEDRLEHRLEAHVQERRRPLSGRGRSEGRPGQVPRVPSRRPARWQSSRSGTRTSRTELCIPQKLYGREKDKEALTATFERVARVRCRAAAHHRIFGHRKVGAGGRAATRDRDERSLRHRQVRSARAPHSLRSHQPCVRRSGPLDPDRVTRDASRSGAQQILDAVGPNGQVIADLVPELALVIGAQPKLQELGPAEAQHRFERTFSAFLSVFARRRQSLDPLHRRPAVGGSGVAPPHLRPPHDPRAQSLAAHRRLPRQRGRCRPPAVACAHRASQGRRRRCARSSSRRWASMMRRPWSPTRWPRPARGCAPRTLGPREDPRQPLLLESVPR